MPNVFRFELVIYQAAIRALKGCITKLKVNPEARNALEGQRFRCFTVFKPPRESW